MRWSRGAARKGCPLRACCEPWTRLFWASAWGDLADRIVEYGFIRREFHSDLRSSLLPCERVGERQIGCILLEPDEIDGETPLGACAAGGIGPQDRRPFSPQVLHRGKPHVFER